MSKVGNLLTSGLDLFEESLTFAATRVTNSRQIRQGPYDAIFIQCVAKFLDYKTSLISLSIRSTFEKAKFVGKFESNSRN